MVLPCCIHSRNDVDENVAVMTVFKTAERRLSIQVCFLGEPGFAILGEGVVYILEFLVLALESGLDFEIEAFVGAGGLNGIEVAATRDGVSVCFEFEGPVDLEERE